MPGSGNKKSDRNGIAIISSPSNDPQSATRAPQSETPHSPLPTPHSPSANPQSPHFSILQYAKSEEQNVRIKPLPRAFHPQPLNYDHRLLLLARLTGRPAALRAMLVLWYG